MQAAACLIRVLLVTILWTEVRLRAGPEVGITGIRLGMKNARCPAQLTHP